MESAIKETQFKKAMENIKDAIPQSLLIDGQNPMTMLYKALSIGIHTKTDDECLEIAHSIRIVLAELSERISISLKDEAELKNALTKLNNLK